MSFGWVSFLRQAQSFRAAQSSATNRYFRAQAGSAQTEKAIGAASSAASAFASAATNYTESANILAARAGVAVSDKTNAAKTVSLSSPNEISDQVSFSGSLSELVDFSAVSASAAKFQFLTNTTALHNAFNAAMLGLTSQGDPIDSVSVSGDMLTAGTSGADTHPVFTLSLDQNSGTWTFKLVNPIDHTPKSLDLTNLAQEIVTDTNTSTLSNVALSSRIKITLSNSDQTTISGALSDAVNGGAVSPPPGGTFQFVTGSKLKDAFKLAMTAETSNGEPIDTVAVVGNTLTASTSGTNAHDVFSITLHLDSGLWTFNLLNPVDGIPDQITNFVTSLNVSGLMQGVASTGQTIDLPNTVYVSVYNDTGPASGTAIAGTVHQGGLAFTAPAPATSQTSTAYTPPTNPLTGHGYAQTSAAAQSIGATLNLFA